MTKFFKAEKKEVTKMICNCLSAFKFGFVGERPFSKAPSGRGLPTKSGGGASVPVTDSFSRVKAVCFYSRILPQSLRDSSLPEGASKSGELPYKPQFDESVESLQ